MTRRRAREYILKTLYQYEFTDNISDFDNIKVELIKENSSEIIAFIEDIIHGTIEHMDRIDQTIRSVSKNWDFNRLASVDRAILRFAAYELLYRKDIPARVTINEAVDISKKYSTQDAYSFINGVLDRIARDIKKA